MREIRNLSKTSQTCLTGNWLQRGHPFRTSAKFFEKKKAVEAVEASKVAEVTEVNEAAEVSKA